MENITDRELIDKYRCAEAAERVTIMLDNYKRYGKTILKIEAKLIYKIKSEKERIRSKLLENEVERVQTSGTSDPTFNQASFNVLLENAINTGDIDTRILSGFEDYSQYENDIRTVSIMKREFEQLKKMVSLLDDDDSKFFNDFVFRNTNVKDFIMADSMAQSYTAVKRKMSKIRDSLILDMCDCIEEKIS